MKRVVSESQPPGGARRGRGRSDERVRTPEEARIPEQVRPLLLTTWDVAVALAISERQVRYLVMRGEIASVLIGRLRRVPLAALERFIEGRLGA